MKINEIFYSLQGEGHWTGTPAVFIRFSGCNLHCDFCDTEHNSGQELSVDEIISEASKYPTLHIIFTGGEPTLQLTRSLVDRLHQLGKYLHIETNGTL
ncbi:MAG: 7-carboxy-7-deazaguanine synthase QueE, partial [Muribaculaceae bacterium]|nr:7-carboxy-7-deazaguanine synthase QueE [Muribaculaceae bacterium]